VPTMTNCIPICGDGLWFPPEECDDQNLISGDGCDSSCKVETLLYSCVNFLGFLSRCRLKCSNGVRDGNEVCDDGNLINWDGCTSSC